MRSIPQGSVLRSDPSLTKNVETNTYSIPQPNLPEPISSVRLCRSRAENPV